MAASGGFFALGRGTRSADDFGYRAASGVKVQNVVGVHQF
jgi:hypothetical protein